MKRIIYTFFTGILCVLNSIGQPFDVILNTAQQGNVTVQARNSITLASGYSYTPNGGTFLTQIVNPVITGFTSYDPAIIPSNYSINTNLAVGKTPGELSVSGMASYTVPLDLPKGSAGLAPNLSLNYVSSFNDGLMGIGWNMGGLSAISRVNQNLYFETQSNPIKGDLTDKYAMDGNRLILTNNKTYGEDLSEYGTELEEFSKVTAKGSSGTGKGPAWFEVRTKSGLICEYGNTSDSKILRDGTCVLTWKINKITDRYGNYITFTYFESDDERPILQILYAGTTSTFAEINFRYKQRSDISTYVYGGKEFTRDLLLDNIEMKNNAQAYKKYEMTYCMVDNRAQLLKVTEYSSQNQPLNPTVFTYTDQTEQLSSNTSFYTNSSKEKVYCGDFNGDGRMDIVTVPFKTDYTSSDMWKLYLANASGNMVYTATGNLYDDFIDIYAADFDGNGLTDLMLVCCNPAYPSHDFHLKVFSGNSFIDAYQGDYLTIDDSYSRYNFVDSNGDGKLEVFGYEPEKSIGGITYPASYILYENNGQGGTNGLICEESITSLGTLAKDLVPGSGYTQIVDFNGDGCSDILSLFDNRYILYEFKGTDRKLVQTKTGSNLTNGNLIVLGDFNGDGTTDIVCTDNRIHGNWSMLTYSKDGFINHSINGFSNFDVFSGVNSLFGYDVNGDGQKDIIFVGKGQDGGNSTNRINVAINKGNGYEYSLTETSTVTFNIIADAQNPWYLYFGDYNGDGRDEFFYSKPGDQRCFSFATGTPNNLLSYVIDGVGAKTQITYKPMSDAAVYARGTGAIYPLSDFSSGMQLVRQVDADDGIGGSFSTTYKYDGAKIHLKGKGFLGFAKTTTNDDTGIFNEKNYLFETPYYYSKLNTGYTKQGTTPVSTFVNTWDVSTYNESNRIFPYISSSVSTDNLRSYTLTTTVVYPTMNLYGNQTNVNNAYSSGVSNSTNFLYEDEKVSDWLIGRPTTITKRSQNYSGNLTVNVTSRSYLSTSNSPDIDQYNSGDNSSWQLNRDYNTFGNLVAEHTGTTGLTDTHATYLYDSNGINIVKATDPIGNQTSYSYDPTTGLSKTQTDPFGNGITFNYNTFDQLSSVVPSTGISTTINSNFNVSGGPTNARYYVDKTGNDGSQTKVWYDLLSRELRTETKIFGGALVKVDKQYNSKGELFQYSEPTTGTPSSWNVIVHDPNGRILQLDPVFGSTVDYSYNLAKTTRTSNGRNYSSIKNANGWITETSDMGGTITNIYKPTGFLYSTTAPGSITTTMYYDENGNRLSIYDPSAGYITNSWYGTGQPKTITNADGQTTTYTYTPDSKVLLQKTTSPEGEINYTYYPNGLVNSILFSIGHIRSHTYELGKIKSVSEYIDAISNTVTFEYDSKGRLYRKYFNGTTEYEQYEYDPNSGYLYRILFTASGAPTTTVWQLTNMDQYQRITQATIGSTSSSWGYDANNLLSSISATGVQGYTYSFNANTGNLSTRTNTLLSKFDNFVYDSDGLDRLTEATGSSPTVSVGYVPSIKNGNIQSKSDAGTYVYDATQPYAVDQITGGLNISADQQNIEYYSFEKVKKITEGTGATQKTAEFRYNADYQRISMVLKTNGTATKTRYYFGGSCERELISTVYTQYIWIGGDAYTAVAVAKKVGTGPWTVYNIFRDHLGTITHLKAGSAITEYSFDAWGRRRDKDDWTMTLTSEPALFADRGFTGHEYLEDFKLYNMNGRLYDPVVGRFLSADPVVQDPSFTQSYNRYSYCLNNPLKYTDPSGNTWWSHFTNWVGDGFNNLGVWWTKNNIPMVGVNMGPRGTIPFVSTPIQGNTNFSIGYNTKTEQFGFGNNSSGFTNFYYPFADYTSPEEIGGNAVAKARGSLFTDQTSAFKYMYQNSLKYKTEYAGIITTKGVIVSKLDEDGGEMWFGNSVTYNKRTHIYSVIFNELNYNIIAHIHTHWQSGLNYWSFVGDPQCDNRTIRLTPNLDFYLMTNDGSLLYRMYDGTNWHDGKSTVDMLLNGYKIRKQ